ncbi:MAG: sulfatase [Candidatus Eisenbacteria bacterium]|nr:sulfatase [Candidatus Eisenbacteria bacterium]
MKIGLGKAVRGRTGAIFFLFALLPAALSCSGGAEKRPNVLWVVWDTARADRFGLYGGGPTTPFLEEWAETARVYEDCLSESNYTLPSHASFFTGLPPSLHGCTNSRPFLSENLVTVAELFRDAGYDTYLWSANPHISKVKKFDQGFETVEHPWQIEFQKRALEIVSGKIRPEDVSSELPPKVRAARVGPWDIKASGALAAEALFRWIDDREEGGAPWFAFLNYMEAHRPYIPPEKYRRRMMSEEEVLRSYEVDRSWTPLWSYTFGLKEYDEEELSVTAGTYDACIAELDDLFRGLIEALRERRKLDDTVVILTSDHGEHLGEHHMLDHQYSLYQQLIHVPLLIRYPSRIPPGRDRRPVMTGDLFPTLLALAGIDRPPAPEGSGAVSLLAPPAERTRIAESLGPFRQPFDEVRRAHPAWDSAPWEREIRAVVETPWKLIAWDDGEKKLFRLDGDPGEERDRLDEEPERAKRLAALLEGRGVAAAFGDSSETPELPEEHREMLRALGYIGGGAAPETSAAREKDGKP